MPREMTPEEVRGFLSEGTRTAKIAVVRKDGRPHVAPVWFVLDGDDVVFNTNSRTTKGYALRRDPRVSLVVDDERPPFGFVRIDGEATISESLPEVREWATAIAARYMGAEQASAFGERNGVPGELLVRVRPVHVVSETDVAGW